MRRFTLSLLAACMLALAAAAPAAAVPSFANPPAGANDFACKPSAAHPNPVVLVHGLGANMAMNWNYHSPKIKARGYCVFAMTYGLDPRVAFLGAPAGSMPIEQSAAEFDAFVTRVLDATGAAKVDLVGHSLGSFMPQYWLKFGGGAGKVDRYVAMTALYEGTTVHGVTALRDAAGPGGLAKPVLDLVASLCTACAQVLAGSPMVEQLKAGGKAAPGVTYTTINSRYDQLIVPYTSGHMPGHTNHVLQDVCPNDISEHVGPAFDPVATRLILNALDPPNAQPVDCSGLPPLAPPVS